MALFSLNPKEGFLSLACFTGLMTGKQHHSWSRYGYLLLKAAVFGNTSDLCVFLFSLVWTNAPGRADGRSELGRPDGQSQQKDEQNTAQNV